MGESYLEEQTGNNDKECEISLENQTSLRTGEEPDGISFPFSSKDPGFFVVAGVFLIVGCIPKAHGTLVSWPVLEPPSLALEGRVSTTGPLGMPPRFHLTADKNHVQILVLLIQIMVPYKRQI